MGGGSNRDTKTTTSTTEAGNSDRSERVSDDSQTQISDFTDDSAESDDVDGTDQSSDAADTDNTQPVARFDGGAADGGNFDSKPQEQLQQILDNSDSEISVDPSVLDEEICERFAELEDQVDPPADSDYTSEDIVASAVDHYQSLDPSQIELVQEDTETSEGGEQPLIDPNEFDLDEYDTEKLRDTYDWILEDDARAVSWVECCHAVDRVNDNPIRQDEPTPGAVEQGLMYATDIQENGHDIIDFKTGRQAEQASEVWEDSKYSQPSKRNRDPDIVETAIAIDIVANGDDKHVDELVRLYDNEDNAQGGYLARYSVIENQSRSSIIDKFALDETDWELTYNRAAKVYIPDGQKLRVSPCSGFRSKSTNREFSGGIRQYTIRDKDYIFDEDAWVALGEISKVTNDRSFFENAEYGGSYEE